MCHVSKCNSRNTSSITATKTIPELQTLYLIEFYNIIQRFLVVHEDIVAITV